MCIFLYYFFLSYHSILFLFLQLIFLFFCILHSLSSFLTTPIVRYSRFLFPSIHLHFPTLPSVLSFFIISSFHPSSVSHLICPDIDIYCLHINRFTDYLVVIWIQFLGWFLHKQCYRVTSILILQDDTKDDMQMCQFGFMYSILNEMIHNYTYQNPLSYYVLEQFKYILESDSFKSHTTGAHHKIQGHITCTTSNIIYLISCRICGIQYIGETKNSLKKRFYGHRSTVKTQKLDTPVGQHFNVPNHSISDMILQGIEALANRRESVRLSREKMWIKRVHTIHPHGLNIQEGND